MTCCPVAFKEILETAPEGAITAKKFFKKLVRLCRDIYTGPIECLQTPKFVSFEAYHDGKPFEALKLAVDVFGSKWLPSLLHTLKRHIPVKDLPKFNAIRGASLSFTTLL